ncbi:hypothetical protein NYR88_01620 [Actinobacillus equuli subsp. haemolyticus]|nr:hypothetical protein NYR88_01620 [Actinobacillus equuli subsp. haemolyticus]
MIEIKLIYIDDHLDPFLSDYLSDKLEMQLENVEFKYNDYEFTTPQSNYLSLVQDETIRESDIIVIDSRLFENHSIEGEKFTGEEFKIILKLSNPFIEVIVISQNDGLEEYGTIKKFRSSPQNDTQDDANLYYERVLLPKVKLSIDKIKQYRKIVKMMADNKDAFKGRCVLDKVDALINKLPDL